MTSTQNSTSAPQQYAAIDADGHFGTQATVYYVGERAQCEGYARRAATQVIDGDGLHVGDKVLRADVPRRAAIYRGVVAVAESRARDRGREESRRRELARYQDLLESDRRSQTSAAEQEELAALRRSLYA
jgi:hypothetical protein